jgi:hypothetical protein
MIRACIKNLFVRVHPIIASVAVLFAAETRAQGAVELQSGWRALGDSLTGPGTFARPQICPVDSSYIAYEMHSDSGVGLFIYDTRSGKSRQIAPIPTSDQTADSAADSIGISPISCGQLAWSPRKIDGGIWAVYIAHRGDESDLYLYEARSLTSHLLWQGDNAVDSSAKAWGNPQWSPDGLCLAFTVVEGANANIRIICDLDNRIGGSIDDITPQDFQPLVSEPGNQFDPVWCPVIGSGLIAFTEQEKTGGRFHIKVYDIYRGRSYGMIGEDTARDYFAPSWGLGGRRLAYYYHRNIYELLVDSLDPAMTVCDFGAAAVDFISDSVTIRPVLSDTIRADRIGVIPNSDVFSGPSWLPGGRSLIVTSENERGQFRMQVISFPELFPQDNRTDFGVRGFGSFRLPYPRDIDVHNRNIAFVFNPPAESRLLIGALEPNIAFVSSIDGLTVDPARQIWWENYAQQIKERRSFASRVWDFLWSPIAGPDIGINKGIVPVAGGIVALAVIIGGNGGGGAVVPTPRDWTPPVFPAKKSSPGIRVEVGL